MQTKSLFGSTDMDLGGLEDRGEFGGDTEDEDDE